MVCVSVPQLIRLLPCGFDLTLTCAGKVSHERPWRRSHRDAMPPPHSRVRCVRMYWVRTICNVPADLLDCVLAHGVVRLDAGVDICRALSHLPYLVICCVSCHHSHPLSCVFTHPPLRTNLRHACRAHTCTKSTVVTVTNIRRSWRSW